MSDLMTLVRGGATTVDAVSVLLEAADSINPADLPPGYPVYMGYGNGNWPDYQAIVNAHPGATVIDFSVYLANIGNAGDIEPGDMTPAQAPTYVKWRLAAGIWRPIVYSSISEMPMVIAELTAAGLNRSQYRVLTAHYGRGKHICAPGACPEATANGITADGTQWENTPGYDLSVLRGDFLGPTTNPNPATAGLGQIVGIAAPDDAHYWLANGDGRIASYPGGGITTVAAGPLNKPVVGIAASPKGGFWLVAADGGIFQGGGAPFYGSMGGKPLNKPVVGMAATRDGNGYWLAAADGGVFTEGTAPFEGSQAGKTLAKPVVGIATTDQAGYWLAAADGGVFSEGDARFMGNMVGVKLAAPVVGIASRPQGDGYWLVAADGGIFTFGAAGFYGSMGGHPLNKPITGIAVSRTGNGYWLVAGDGGVFSFGDAPFLGSAA